MYCGLSHHRATTMTTQFLDQFPNNHKHTAAKLLLAWITGELPRYYEPDEVVLMYEPANQRVFLINKQGQSAMLNDKGALEEYYSTPEYGNTGFFDDLMKKFKTLSITDKKYVYELALKLDRVSELPETYIKKIQQLEHHIA